MVKYLLLLLVVACGTATVLGAQKSSQPLGNVAAAPTRESLTANAIGKLDIGHPTWMIESAKCDDAGNIYTRRGDQEMSGAATLLAPIRELSPDLRPVATFRMTNLLADGLKSEGRTGFVDNNGRVYVVTSNQREVYVVEFARQGSVKARTKLDLDSYVEVSGLAVFRSGGYLLVGQTGKNLRTPFEAVFRKDGRLLKRIYEPEDEEARQKAELGDSKYILAGLQVGNKFAASVDAAAGSDGNIYLLHTATSPALVYVVSPTGDVLRKLRIDAGKSGVEASSIHSFAGRLAIEFNFGPKHDKNLIRVIDPEGKPIANYEVTVAGLASSPSLACYSSEGFTMISGYAAQSLQSFRVKLP